MKKKVAIITKKLIIGGIEKCLLEMLDAMDLDEIDITLFIEEEMPQGGFQEFIPPQIKIKNIFADEESIKTKIIKNLKNRDLKKAIQLFLSGIKIYYYNVYYKKPTCKIRQPICSTLDCYPDQFDLAISYHNPVSFSVLYTIDKIKANKKVMWIHSNIEEYIEEVDTYKSYFPKFDKIFAVSSGGKDSFISRYPYLEDSTDIFYNRIVKKKIQEKVNKNIKVFPNKAKKIILTTARLSPEKGVDFIPEVAKKLKDAGYLFEWYILGDGNRKLVMDGIEKLGLSDTIFLLGNQMNPYNYFYECDIYVQPSRFEGYVTTITEAKCLEKPIVGTNIIGINDQITNGVNGLLVNKDVDSLYQGIKQLFDNPELKKRLVSNLKREEIDTTNEIQKLYDLL